MRILVLLFLTAGSIFSMNEIIKKFDELDKKNEEETKKIEAIFKNNYSLLMYDYNNNPYSDGQGIKLYCNLLLNTQTNVRQIYKINQRIVGFYIAYKIRTFNNKHNKNFLPLDAVLVLMAVDENERRKGYGTDIINQVIQWAKTQGCPAIWVSVNGENRSAINLYKKLGFSKTSMYRNPELGTNTSIWLLKKLSNSSLYELSFLSRTNHDLRINYSND